MACRSGEPLAEAARRAGLPVWPLDPLVEFDVFAARNLRSRLRSHEVIIAHAHTGHAVGVGALAVRGTGCGFVATRQVVSVTAGLFLVNGNTGGWTRSRHLLPR